MDLELHFAADAIALLPATRARLRNDKSARPGFGRTSRVISDIVKRRSIRAQCAAQKGRDAARNLHSGIGKSAISHQIYLSDRWRLITDT
jgi:hypothetical protein